MGKSTSKASVPARCEVYRPHPFRDQNIYIKVPDLDSSVPLVLTGKDGETVNIMGGNRGLLKFVCGRRAQVRWDGVTQRWIVKATHFQGVVNLLLKVFGSCRITMDFTDREICDYHCQSAESGSENCECSCMGKFHGKWTPLSEFLLPLDGSMADSRQCGMRQEPV